VGEFSPSRMRNFQPALTKWKQRTLTRSFMACGAEEELNETRRTDGGHATARLPSHAQPQHSWTPRSRSCAVIISTVSVKMTRKASAFLRQVMSGDWITLNCRPCPKWLCRRSRYFQGTV
jgi:hypothetical protein